MVVKVTSYQREGPSRFRDNNSVPSVRRISNEYIDVPMSNATFKKTRFITG